MTPKYIVNNEKIYAPRTVCAGLSDTLDFRLRPTLGMTIWRTLTYSSHLERGRARIRSIHRVIGFYRICYVVHMVAYALHVYCKLQIHRASLG